MNDKQHYELMFIVPAKFAGEELSSIKDKVKDLLAQSEGEITKESDMGRRRLAYPIKHVYQGFYFVMEFDVLAGALEKINTSLKLMPEILRYLLITKRVLTERELQAEERLNAAIRAELIEKGVIKEDRRYDSKKDSESADDSLETPSEKPAEAPKKVKEKKVVEETVEAPVVKEEEAVDESKLKLEELNENLDDIISGDINDLL